MRTIYFAIGLIIGFSITSADACEVVQDDHEELIIEVRAL